MNTTTAAPSATYPVTIATVQTRSGSIRVEMPANQGPLFAYRSAKPAEKALARFYDVAEDRTGDGVAILDDLDGQGRFHVPFIEYPRECRR